MADRFFDSSGPPELILHIFRQCDSFHDASDLSMTCRRMHNAWSANGFGARLVWKFWLRDFPAVREALVAVRAAQVVLDTEKRDELPPKAMDLEALSADKTLPTMSELNLVWDLICLAQVIESEVLTSECYSSPADMIERYRQEAPEDPERMPEWRNGFWTAMFRTLIAAAALAGVYQEPFHSSEKGQEDHQQEWVRKFVVLQNITVVEEEKPLFGFLDDWLMANILSDTVARDAMAQRFERNFGRATQCHEDCPLSAVEGLSHSDAHLVVWEVMKMFWMTQAILASIELESHDSIEDKGQSACSLVQRLHRGDDPGFTTHRNSSNA